MAKDRTRHARRREPGSRQESPLDVAARETAQALVDLSEGTMDVLVGFAEGTWQALFGFADAVSSAVSDCAEMCRRLTDGTD